MSDGRPWGQCVRALSCLVSAQRDVTSESAQRGKRAAGVRTLICNPQNALQSNPLGRQHPVNESPLKWLSAAGRLPLYSNIVDGIREIKLASALLLDDGLFVTASEEDSLK